MSFEADQGGEIVSAGADEEMGTDDDIIATVSLIKKAPPKRRCIYNSSKKGQRGGLQETPGTSPIDSLLRLHHHP